ncbi:MAG: energy transducer TonB [Pseudomonadota bacterium]
MTRLRDRHLAAGMAAAAALHLAAAWIWADRFDRSGAVGAGEGGISIGLGPTGGLQGAETLEDVEAVEAIEPDAAEVVENEVVEAETPETVEVEPLETVPIEAVETVEAVEPPVLEPMPEETVAVEAEVPEPTETVEVVEAVEAAPPEPQPEPEVEVSAPMPTARPRPPEPTRQRAEAPRRQEVAAAPETPQETRNAAAAPQTAGPAGNQAEVGAGDDSGEGAVGDDRAGGGDPGARQDYVARITALLQRAKKYPRRARQRGQQGIGRLQFVVDGSGRLIDARVAGSSGHDLLDEELLALARRAAPLPPIPASMGVARLQLTIPIRFELR